MTEYETIAAVTAVVALIPATWIALRIARSNRFNPAATEFVAAFSVAIRALKDGESDTYIIQEQLSIHERAMDKFILNLSGGSKSRFRETWQRYENHCKKRMGDDAMMQHGMATLFARDIGTDARNNHALALIEEILKFANHKK
jgi:hypothetical protein